MNTDTSDLVYRLLKRAEIRRQIPGRKSVEEGKPDRIADLLEEAAEALQHDWNAEYLKAVDLHNQTLDELRLSEQSEREGWRYADELEQERKALQAMLNAERNESEARIAALEDEAKRLRSVMAAAAETIASKWEAHCDEDGYGPVNLLRRLEEGIAAEYNYTAGSFIAQQNVIEALQKALRGFTDREFR